MAYRIAILKHNGTEDETILRILPTDYDSVDDAWEWATAIEDSDNFDPMLSCRIINYPAELETN